RFAVDDRARQLGQFGRSPQAAGIGSGRASRLPFVLSESTLLGHDRSSWWQVVTKGLGASRTKLLGREFRGHPMGPGPKMLLVPVCLVAPAATAATVSAAAATTTITAAAATTALFARASFVNGQATAIDFLQV